MRMLPYKEFELFLSNDFTDLYDWFEVKSIQGLTKAESVALMQHKQRIQSFVNYSPKDVLRGCEHKPYMYLNREMINDLSVHESSFIIMGACLQMAKILASGSDEDKIYSFAESLALNITDLNYPEVYMRL